MRAVAGHIATVEGLRGVAVLWVMVFHFVVLRSDVPGDAFVAALSAAEPLSALARNGYLGVDLFFILSGFLLTLPWFRHAQAGLPPPESRAFYARRARRIVPAYYVQLVALFFVFVPLLHPRLWIDSTPFVVANLGAHLAFLHYTNPLSSASLTVNGALWTLAIEVQYYLLLPLVAPLFVRWPWRSLAAAAAIAAGWRWLAANEMALVVEAFQRLGAKAGLTEAAARHLLATQLPAWALHFALGIVSGRAWLSRRRCADGAMARSIAALIATLALGGLVAALLHGTAWLGPLGWMAYALTLSAGLCALVLAPCPGLTAFVASAPLAALGRISYSAYLWHLPLLLLFNACLPATGGWLAFPLWLALVVAVSAASYAHVERPCLAPSRTEPAP